ncbi:MAG: hypothetical protein KDB27_08540 [Planctomycetales bacterium]|nr:hypothetical protein [Planctomycetales bacterium]
MPLGFPLEVERQQRVDQILRFWEVETAKITTFKADYERREYDPVMGPVGKPNAIVRGHVRYYAPDRGLMQDKQIYNFDPGAGQGDKPFKLAEDQHGEDWVCTGTSIFLKQPENKLLIERQLPPDLQGKAISEGPLPFLFGAKAETMKRRFWIREVTPKDNPNGDYFLEAIPKNREDAANYERVVVVLDKKDHFLPKKMEVTIRTLQAKGGAGKPGKTLRRVDVYVFKDRKVNDPTDRVKGFFATFVRPTLPKGWKTQVLDWNMQPVNGPIAEQPASSRQAQTRPKTDPRRAR